MLVFGIAVLRSRTAGSSCVANSLCGGVEQRTMRGPEAGAEIGNSVVVCEW